MIRPPRTTRRAALLGGAALLAARPALAQLRVDVSRGRVEPMPIAISPFLAEDAAAGDLAREVPQLVAADLTGSGLFRLVDPAAYIQSADEIGAMPRFSDWRQIGAQALVTGVVRTTGTTATVEFRLWDVFGGSQLTGVRFDGPADLWRRLGHKTADSIYERLTGEKGYFDTRIAYIAESGQGSNRVKRLAIMDQDGANHGFLTDGRHLVLTPRLSPDTRRLAYLAYRNIVPQVFIRDLVTGQESVVDGPPGMTFSPRWSPDGRTLLVTVARDGNSDLYAYDLGSGRSTRLTDGTAIDTSPSYAPNGRRIVFNSDRAGGPQLYVADFGGGAAQRISFEDGRYGDPAWSPRGDLIAFTKIKGGLFHIGVMQPNGADERLLTSSYLEESPAWAPNGRVIVFSRLDRGRDSTRLFTIDITGYNERQLPTPLDATDPDWSALLP